MTDRQHRRRRGTTAVEFGVVAPLVFLLFFAAFEFSRMNMIRHTAEVAVYEGARRGIVPGATADHVRARVTQIMGTAGVQDMTITVTPETLTDETTDVAVTVSIPLNNNAWVMPTFLTDMQIESTSVMQRELF
jgi:Flp pilus assembly protein TadG